MLGLAYKPNVDDARESPSLYIFSELLKTGASVDYSDPFFKTFPETRKYDLNSECVDINAENLASYDAVIMHTNHEAFDLPLIHSHAKLIIDTRGVFKPDGTKVIRA